jgi:hypothetical protein
VSKGGDVMRVLITGATGFIGTAVGAALAERGDAVIPLRRGPKGSGPRWDPDAGSIDENALEGVDVVIHLAGASILPPWTKARKERILESRRKGTSLIAQAVAAAGTPVLICASGMDYYGERGDEPLTETAPKGSGFMSDVVEVWESSASAAREAGSRVVHLRTSLVVDSSGGSLPLIMLPFRFFVGGPIGDGRQWWSWITLTDHVRAILHVLDHSEVSGPVNLSSPNPVSNRDFMRALGSAMGRPCWFPTPALLVKSVLGSDAAESLVLESKRVLPDVLTRSGFVFSYPEIGAALDHAVH